MAYIYRTKRFVPGRGLAPGNMIRISYRPRFVPDCAADTVSAPVKATPPVKIRTASDYWRADRMSNRAAADRPYMPPIDCLAAGRI